MIRGKSPGGFSPSGDGTAGNRRAGRISVRFRRGPAVALILGVLLWVGLLVATWRLLLRS
jgi:hypothetical protein